jgi:hypothetical protein
VPVNFKGVRLYGCKGFQLSHLYSLRASEPYSKVVIDG